ncbi:peptide deformylase [Pontimicrobium sp. MEBiC01747]|jgi:peptide deformylase
MILPIVAYGDPVLKKKATEITAEYPNLKELVDNMHETMYGAYGLGIAAPQIGLSIRLFVVDASPFAEDKELSQEERDYLNNFKHTFINPVILEETGEEWAFNEGCLSIPDVREDVFRKPNVKIEYYDLDFKKHTIELTGIAARIVQHEYDHIEGVLFTDKLSALKKRLIKGKLANISKGKVGIDYRMRFPNQKKKR